MDVLPGAGWGRRFLWFSCSRRGSAGWGGGCWGDWRGSFTGLKTVKKKTTLITVPVFEKYEQFHQNWLDWTGQVRNLYWDHFYSLKPLHETKKGSVQTLMKPSMLRQTQTDIPISFPNEYHSNLVMSQTSLVNFPFAFKALNTPSGIKSGFLWH